VRTNRTEATAVVTHEGGPARHITPIQQLTRSLNACLLWEDTFYEDGASIADRIYEATLKVSPEEAAALAVKARGEMNLRHAPLMVAVAMVDSAKHRALVSKTLAGIIQRPDELGEFLSLYWKVGKERHGKDKRPLAAQVKRGLALAVGQFDAYQLAKWKGAEKSAVKVRDVLRLVHPKPISDEQAATFKGIIDGTLEAPDTWEVALSAGGDKRATFERLMSEKALGGMAFLMNLRNMVAAGVPVGTMAGYAEAIKFRRVLPYRFIVAERHAPAMSAALEKAMLATLDGEEKGAGKTLILVDVSGSMQDTLSNARGKPSESTRLDAAAALAIHAREVFPDCRVYTFSTSLVEVPNRRGFGLRDAIVSSQPHGGTLLGAAVTELNKQEYARLIVITDEQSADRAPNPIQGAHGYMMNVAPYENGVGYGPWVNITGFSAQAVRYILASEAEAL